MLGPGCGEAGAPRRRAACLAFLLAGLLPWPSGARAESGPAADAVATLSAPALQALLPALRAGGLVVFFRHASTRHDQRDQRPVRIGDCTTQRNLSDEGRRLAQAIGAAWRRLAIPVGQVLSSPYCRTRDTAQLAFGAPETRAALSFVMGLPKAQRAQRGAALRRLLAQVPAAGNTVVVGHTANLEEAVGLWPKPEGVAVLFRPDRAGGWAVLGRVRPETWAQVAAAGAEAR